MSRRIERDDARYYPSAHRVGDIYGTTRIWDHAHRLSPAIIRSPQIFPQPDREASHSGNGGQVPDAAWEASSSDDRRGSHATGTVHTPVQLLPVPGEGIEPPTFGLQNRCSTAELTRHRGCPS